MNEKKLWLVHGGFLPVVAVRAGSFDEALAAARVMDPGYYSGHPVGTGVRLFREVLAANEDYEDTIRCECPASMQEEALALCRVLWEEVRAQGLCSEYREYVERRALA